MYSYKCLLKKVTQYSIEATIEKYKRYELYAARKNNTIKKFCNKWLITEYETNEKD